MKILSQAVRAAYPPTYNSFRKRETLHSLFRRSLSSDAESTLGDRTVENQTETECPSPILIAQEAIKHLENKDKETFAQKRENVLNWGLIDFKSFLPSLELIDLYKVKNCYTPMGYALYQGDLSRISELVSKGWSYFIELDCLRYPRFRIYFEKNSIRTAEDMLYAIFFDKSGSKDLWRKSMGILCSAPHTGITLSNQFDRALELIRSNPQIASKYNRVEYVLALFDMGLIPEKYIVEGEITKRSWALVDKLEKEFVKTFYWRGCYETQFDLSCSGPILSLSYSHESLKQLLNEAHKRGWSNRSAQKIMEEHISCKCMPRLHDKV